MKVVYRIEMSLYRVTIDETKNDIVDFKNIEDVVVGPDMPDDEIEALSEFRTRVDRADR